MATPNGFDALTPLGEQMGIITPGPLHFISSHGDALRMSIPRAPADDSRHGGAAAGLHDGGAQAPAVGLRIHFIECLANRPQPGEERTLDQNHGLIGCSEWTGVPLSLLLKEAGVKSGAKWVVGESLGRTQQAGAFRWARR